MNSFQVTIPSKAFCRGEFSKNRPLIINSNSSTLNPCFQKNLENTHLVSNIVTEIIHRLENWLTGSKSLSFLSEKTRKAFADILENKGCSFSSLGSSIRIFTGKSIFLRCLLSIEYFQALIHVQILMYVSSNSK